MSFGRDGVSPVRCPSPACGRIVDVLPEWLGRNMYCPACGVRMTARPIAVETRLREKQNRVSGGRGEALRRLPLLVLVDNLRSMWNVGSIFRTADACGVRQIMLTGISPCPPRAEISKTALGAEEAVAWSYHADAVEALREARRRGYRPVALENSDTAVPVDDLAWAERVCLVIGNEVAGVSSALLELCDAQVRIPMLGVKNTLNVAVAFGIAAHRAAAALAVDPPRS